MPVSRSPSPRVPKPVEPSVAPGLLQPQRFFAMAVCGLLVARWLLPTEGVLQGETLWVVPLWVLLASWGAWLGSGHNLAVQPSSVGTGGSLAGRIAADQWALWAMLALVVAISVGVVRAGAGGETFVWRRTAVTLWAEWMGVFAAFLALRALLRTGEFRSQFAAVLLATAATVSVLGIWQHFVMYPQMAAEVGAQLDELRALEEQGRDTTALKYELAASGIPTEGAARILFEDRLRESREPFGFFALANTLGGHLAVALVFAVAAVASVWRGEPTERKTLLSRGSGFALLLVIAVCLWLTASRTAFVGAAVGLAFWGLGQIPFLAPSMLTGLRLAFVLGLIVCFSPLTFLDWHGWTDAADLPGPLKSLQYRFQYWAATQDILVQHWWLGIGLGQFRAAYLQHKLPVASEEIADPHNLFFDLHANAGLFGLLAFAGLLIVLALAPGWKSRQKQEHDLQTPSEPPPDAWREGAMGGLLGFAAVFAVLMMRDGAWDDRLLVLAPVWGGFYWLAARFLSSSAPDWLKPAAQAAGLALVVHLLGAGGIQTPAVSELLVVCLVLGTMTSGSEVATAASPSLRRRVAFAGGLGILAVFITVVCLFPVWRSNQWLAESRRMMVERGNPDAAIQLARLAGEIDPWSPEPPLLAAETAYRAWQSQPQDQARFQEAVDWQELAIQRDPQSPQGFARLGERWLERARRDDLSGAAPAAVDALKTAVSRYPTSASLRADLAEAHALSGERDLARQTARQSLEQDALNRQLGHRDRYLAEDVVARLQKLANAEP